MNQKNNEGFFLPMDDYFKKTLESKRWGILVAIFFYTYFIIFIHFFICFKRFTNQGTWCTYGPIVEPSMGYYNISSNDVNWFIYSFYITYAIFSFFVNGIVYKRNFINFLYIKKGSWLLYNKFALAIILGSVVNAIGSWIRYFAGSDFTLAIIGQVIMGISFCLVLEAPIRF